MVVVRGFGRKPSLQFTFNTSGTRFHASPKGSRVAVDTAASEGQCQVLQVAPDVHVTQINSRNLFGACGAEHSRLGTCSESLNTVVGGLV